MKRYILHQFPVKPRTYIALLLASLLTVVITFFIEITDYAQLLFKQKASNLMPLFEPQVVMIMATIAYLTGTIRTPLTATFVTLEMTSTMHLILPALMVAFIANYFSKLIKKQPLYETMADNYIKITSQ
jgi:H+/Cl- antiporter ClcA